MITCVPSFLTLCGLEEVNVSFKRCLMEHPEIQRADWGRELYLLDKYDSRLFDRAGEEIREGVEHSSNQQVGGEFQEEWVQLMYARYGHLPTFANWEPGRYRSAAFSDQAAEKWFSRVTDDTSSVVRLSSLRRLG
jgi:hypothetical protein